MSMNQAGLVGKRQPRAPSAQEPPLFLVVHSGSPHPDGSKRSAAAAFTPLIARHTQANLNRAFPQPKVPVSAAR